MTPEQIERVRGEIQWLDAALAQCAFRWQRILGGVTPKGMDEVRARLAALRAFMEGSDVGR